MKAEPLSLSFLGWSVAFAVAVWIGLNLILFTVLYGDTFKPLTLPYSEDFDQLRRLDYRQFGGTWRINDGKLIQKETKAADLLAVIPLVLPRNQPYQWGAHLEILKGPNGGGLVFNLQHPDSLQQSQIVRFGADKGRNYLVYGYFDEKLTFVQQGSLAPPDISQGVDLVVFVHKKTYDILVNSQVVQRDIPLHYNGGRVALTTWFSSVAFDDVSIIPVMPQPVSLENATAQPAPAAAIVTKTMALTTAIQSSNSLSTERASTAPNRFFDEKFASDVNQAQWTPVSGEWRFEPGALVQQKADGYDYSTLYATQFAQFSALVRFRHQKGSGGGVLFNMPDVGSKKNGHMVRYFENNLLVWGYFDAKGVFVGQGNLKVAAPGDQAHTLEIMADNATYRILLDNQLVTENMPLMNKQGYIGLTASQSVVAFEEVKVTAFTPVQK